MTVRILVGDCIERLRELPSKSVHCCVTSPPYWRCRDYGVEGQCGAENDPDAYIAKMVEVFDYVHRVLADDGSLWLNIGEKWSSGGCGGGGKLKGRKAWGGIVDNLGWRKAPDGYKDKDVTLLPSKVFDALRQAGWYLRIVIAWDKKRSAEPARPDRVSQSHEYVAHLVKSKKYYWPEEVKESWRYKSCWQICPDGTALHPAMMPAELARRCIELGCPPGGTVLDPFFGAGTTGLVADKLGRDCIGIELNPKYAEMGRDRINGEAPLFSPAMIVEEDK